jgi:hypothetical protein
MKGVVTNEQQWDFIRLFAAMIKGKLALSGVGQLLATGNKDRKYLVDMIEYWQDQGHTNVLNLFEYHYYNAMGKADLAPLNGEERALVGDVPVLIGEVSSASEARGLGTNTWTEITEKMDWISQNGFAGGLFWHDESLDNTNHDDRYLSAAEWAESTNWVPGITRTWHASGRRASRTFRRPDFFGAVYYHYEDAETLEPRRGRLDVAVYGEPGYEGAVGLRYDYLAGSDIDYEVDAYPGADYSDPGNPLLTGSPTTFIYYINGNIAGIVYPYQEAYTIRWADGTYSNHISEVTDSRGKAYIFRSGGDYDWGDRYDPGNYIGYRDTWDANLYLYGGVWFFGEPETPGDDTPEFQSLYHANDDRYNHLDTYQRTGPGWGPGQSVDPAEANHPLTLDAILLRPHIDPLAEIIDVYDVTAVASGNGRLDPNGELLVPHGVTVRFAIAADRHYHIGSILTNGAPVNGEAFDTGFTDTTLAWSNVVADGAIQVVFEENLWTNNTRETWLALYYPGIVDFESLSLTDTDGDGFVAWQEFWAGTDPTNTASELAFTGAWFVNGSNSVSWLSDTNWSTVPYVLMRCTNLVEGKWDKVDGHIPRTPPTNVYCDASAWTGVPIFYRVVVTNAPQETP